MSKKQSPTQSFYNILPIAFATAFRIVFPVFRASETRRPIHVRPGTSATYQETEEGRLARKAAVAGSAAAIIDSSAPSPGSTHIPANASIFKPGVSDENPVAFPRLSVRFLREEANFPNPKRAAAAPR